MSCIAAAVRRGDRARLDLEERARRRLERRHALGGDEPVRRVVGTEREQLGVLASSAADAVSAMAPTVTPRGPPPMSPPLWLHRAMGWQEDTTPGCRCSSARARTASTCRRRSTELRTRGDAPGRVAADDHARRHGWSRRRFLLSSAGLASGLAILQACSDEQSSSDGTEPGGVFSVPRRRPPIPTRPTRPSTARRRRPSRATRRHVARRCRRRRRRRRADPLPRVRRVGRRLPAGGVR